MEFTAHVTNIVCLYLLLCYISNCFKCIFKLYGMKVIWLKLILVISVIVSPFQIKTPLCLYLLFLHFAGFPTMRTVFLRCFYSRFYRCIVAISLIGKIFRSKDKYVYISLPIDLLHFFLIKTSILAVLIKLICFNVFEVWIKSSIIFKCLNNIK